MSFADTLTFETLRAGKAEITIKSKKSGEHITFKITAPSKITPLGGRVTDHDATIRFVNIMRGSEQFLYAGVLTEHGIEPTGKSKVLPRHKAFQGVAWFIRQVAKGGSLDAVEVAHAGKCMRCGRKLTHPQSIESGFGPECAGRSNVGETVKGKVEIEDCPGNAAEAALAMAQAAEDGTL